MKKLTLGLTLVAMLAASGSASPSSSMTSMLSNPLITSLTSSLGLNATQATGGAGALLGLAQHNLASADWNKVAATIPGAKNLISSAKSLGGIKQFTNLAALSGPFKKMGLKPEDVTKMIPALTDYVGKAGGAEVGNLLKGAIK